MQEKFYLIADVYGMCGGVHAALDLLEKLLVSPGGTVYVFHELVHNRSVTESFRRRGVIFAEKISDIPPGATLVIGAHGVAPDVERELRRRAGICLDATCPLVKKLHRIAEELTPEDELVIFGKSGHPEVTGTAGHSGTDKVFLISAPEEVGELPPLRHPVFISQTTVDHGEVERTLSLLRDRFPDLRECSGICEASRKRQEAVIALSRQVDAVLVIGSAHSSNARRLREIAGRGGCAAFLIDDAGEITPEMLKFPRIGVTGGASTPQYLFDGVLEALRSAGYADGGRSAPPARS